MTTQPDTTRDELVKALRELVATMHNDLFGAYGAEDWGAYEAQYEREVQQLADAIERMVKDGNTTND